MGFTVTASYGYLRHAVAVPAPDALPKPNRPDEFWWIEWCEDMPLQPACISFEGDRPSKIQQLGDDSWGTPLDEVPHIRLIERILPAGRVAEVITLLEEIHREQTAPWPDRALGEAIEMLRGEPA